MRAPPLLPITAVALTGVLAMSAINAFDLAPKFMARASAFAQSAKAPGAADAKKAPEADKGAPGADKTADAAKDKPPATNMPPACAVPAGELAKEAGLSPAELQALQNLSARRGQLDDREKALDTQIQLLNAADAKVETKLKALTQLKSEVQALLGQADQKSNAEIDRLVTVYSKMKPKDAAAIMTALDDKIRVPVAAKMKEKDLSAILAQMPTLEAKKLTELMANRFAPAKTMSEALANPPPEPVADPNAQPAAVAAAPKGKAAKPGKAAAGK
jgi:flagellar motility protein MotE (MotC chaperone)